MKYILSIGFLALFIGWGIASASTTVKSSKSNSSEKEITVCKTIDCCKANPKATTPSGTSCALFLSRDPFVPLTPTPALAKGKPTKEQSPAEKGVATPTPAAPSTK